MADQSNVREVYEGLRRVAIGERPIWSITVTRWGSGPSSPTVGLYDVNGDAVGGAFSGAATANGDVITLPPFNPDALTPGATYKAVVPFSMGSMLLSCYLMIEIEPA